MPNNTVPMTLIPIGGLCNRLRAMLSVAESGRDVDVLWHANSECAARWEELFEPVPFTGLHIKPCPLRHRPGLWRLRLNKYLHLAQVYSGLPLREYDTALVQRITPLPSLMQRIDALCQGFTPHTIGLHIRRTDNQQSIAVSTDEAFRRRIDTLIAADPEATFFLATDDDDLRRELVRAYAPRITCQDIPAERHTLQGMQAAVVDLWTLARTGRIIGSHWSSFSSTAAEIGGIPFEVCK